MGCWEARIKSRIKKYKNGEEDAETSQIIEDLPTALNSIKKLENLLNSIKKTVIR